MTVALILLLAVMLDLALGDPPNALHPTAWMGQIIFFGKRHAPVQNAVAQFLFGAWLIVLGATLFALLAYLALRGVRLWNEIAFVIASAVLLKTTFTLRGLMCAARDVQIALDKSNLSGARRLVAWHLVSRDTRELDAPHVVSATVESVAENLADSIVAPLFYFALLGLPGAFAYRFVNTADAIIGYRGATEYLGKFAARFDDVLNFVPSRLSGLLVVIAAILTRADVRGAWRVMMRDHARTASPNAGYPMSAMAGALGVQLEKVSHYTLGDATSPLIPRMIARSIRIVFAASILWISLLTLYYSLLAGY
jgi:adenosylcobinamide-phosphate synthase